MLFAGKWIKPEIMLHEKADSERQIPHFCLMDNLDLKCLKYVYVCDIKEERGLFKGGGQ